MLAFALDGRLVALDPDQERLESSALLEGTEALAAVMDAVGRALLATRPDVVRVLLPEPTYKGSYQSLAPRAGLETVVRLAAVKAKIDVEILDRRTARSRLGLPRQGNLEEHVGEILPEASGRYWAAGRRLAAIAAVAEDM